MFWDGSHLEEINVDKQGLKSVEAVPVCMQRTWENLASFRTYLIDHYALFCAAPFFNPVHLVHHGSKIFDKGGLEILRIFVLL